MNQIILASHGNMSAGMKDTVSMVFGDLPNLYVVATTRDEKESVGIVTRRLLDGFQPEDQVFILTDVLGGSVNNEMMALLREYPKVIVICGMNLSLVLNLALAAEPLLPKTVEDMIAQAREQIINCTAMLKNAVEEEEDDL